MPTFSSKVWCLHRFATLVMFPLCYCSPWCPPLPEKSSWPPSQSWPRCSVALRGHLCYTYYSIVGLIRETRKGRPLLTVETEVNGDSKSTNERGPSLVGSSYRAETIDFCSALAYLVSPIFFISPSTISVPLSPSPNKLGRQPCWVACLLV